MADPTPEPGTPSPFRIRSLTLPVYVPTFLFSLGQGAIIPVIPLFATDLGSTVAFAALAVGLRGFGTMLFDVPAGLMVGKIGERWSMLVASFMLIAVALVTTVITSPIIYAAAVFVMGCAWSIWLLARLTYVSDRAPVEVRGRALALIGGTNRAGHFVGPAIGGFLGVFLGLEYVFWMHAILGLAASVVMFIMVKENTGTSIHTDDSMYRRLVAVVVDHRRIFMTAGVAAICLQVLRNVRQAVIPLWGEAIGLDAAEIGIIFAISSGFDMLLFYPMGIIMDRYGRKWAGVPAMIVLAISMAALPLTDSFLTLTVVGILAGLGNGISSGINMTLGADFSPPGSRGEFLGVWRLVSDVGTAGGPIVIAAIASATTLGVACVATGGIGIIGAIVMITLVPEPLKRRVPT
ncbi:MAG: MFS transporter [Dehalococcoidia bacterium]